MLNDTASMNPRGRVKLELYNDSGVYHTREKKNLVVTSANEIVANMMSNPAMVSRLRQTDKGSTESAANDEGLFIFNLGVQSETVKSASQDVLSTNTDTVFNISDIKDVTKLLSISVGGVNAVIDEDVFLTDAELGIITFKSAPKAAIEVKYQMVANKQMSIIEGTESVYVAGEKWNKGITPSNVNKVYSVDYKKGELLFEATTTNISVEYDYSKHYGLGFMGLGGKPENHPDHQPVSFSQSNKSLVRMDNELEGSRMPVIYPSTVEEGKPEVEVLPTKPVAFDEISFEIFAADNDGDQNVDTVYELDVKGKKVLEIVSVTKMAQNPDEQDQELVVGTDVNLKDSTAGTIEFVEVPTDGTKYKIIANVQSNNFHLNYQLSISPVVELVRVVHEDAFTNKVVAYDIADRGMKIGSGDVWMMNANAGIMQFNSNPSNGVPVNNPGQLTIEYKVNSGTVVKYIADFPKGVPGPVKLEKTDTFTSSGETTFILSQVVAKNESGVFEDIVVTRNGDPETFNLHADGTKIDVDNAVNGDVIVVKFFYNKDAHEIYQVAMFDEMDKTTSKMFNISGIGPVTKDANTGMRITWSVTY